MGWITLGLWSLAVAYTELTRPKPEDATKPEGPRYPNAAAGVPIPLFYGQRTIQSGNVVFAFRKEVPVYGLTSSGLFGDDTRIVGYNYRWTVVYCLGIANNSTDADDLLEVFVEDKPITILKRPLQDGDLRNVFSGEEFSSTNHPSTRSMHVQENNIFESYEVEERGTGGADVNIWAHYYNGNSSQGRDSHVTDAYNELGWRTDFQPTYRGFHTVVIEGFFRNFGADLPKISFRIGSLPNSLGRGGVTIDAGRGLTHGQFGVANPAEVLYDIMTGTFGKVGLDTSFIDTSSFQSVADTLETEEHGMSLLLDQFGDAQPVIDRILEQIDGYLYEDPSTQQITLGLVRTGYSVPGLTALTADNCKVVSVSQTSSDDLYSEVAVRYEDLSEQDAEAVETASDTSTREDTGRYRSAPIRFIGVPNAKLAQQLASREAIYLGSPTVTIRVAVNRIAWDLHPGGRFRLSYTFPDGTVWTDEVFVIQRIDLGGKDEGLIYLDAIKDKFDPARTIFNTSVPPPPRTVVAAAEIDIYKVRELPQQLMLNLETSGQISSRQVAGLGIWAAQPNARQTYFRAQLVDSGTSGAGARGVLRQNIGFCGHAKLKTALTASGGYSGATLELEGFTQQSDNDLFTTPTVSQIRSFGKHLVLVGDEWIAFSTAVDGGGGDYTLNTCYRGMLDSSPTDHAVGTDVWFMEDRLVESIIVPDFPWDTTSILAINLLSHAGRGFYDPDNAVVVSETIEEDWKRPYPPTRYTINALLDVSGDNAILDRGDVDVIFRQRSRDAAQFTLTTDANEQPASTVTHELQVLDQNSNWKTCDTWIYTDDVSNVPDEVLLENFYHAVYSVDAAGIVLQGLARILAKDSTDGNALRWPVIRIDAPHWRNLLGNPSFDESLLLNNGVGWTTTSGTPISNQVDAQGGTGRCLAADTADVSSAVEQQIDVSEIFAAEGRVQLALVLYYKQDDTMTGDLDVTITLRDGTTSLSSTTNNLESGASTTEWNRAILTVSTTNNDVDNVLVEIDMQRDEFQDNEYRIDNCILIADTAYTFGHQSYIGGLTTGWTNNLGSGLTGVLSSPFAFVDNGYARGTRVTAGTDSWYTDETLPAGYGAGDRVLLYSRKTTADDASGHSGLVTLSCRDASSELVSDASADTNAASTNDWELVINSLEIPGETTTIRIEPQVTSDDASVPDVYWGDHQLFFLENFLVTDLIDIDYRSPTIQTFPSTGTEWNQFASAPSPRSIHNFAETSGVYSDLVGDEHLLIAGNPARGGAVIGVYTATGVYTKRAVESIDGTYNGVYIHARDRYSVDDTSDWCILLGFRIDAGGAGGLAGTRDGGRQQGWDLRVDANGQLIIRVSGVGGSVTITLTEDYADGAPHYVAVQYDGSAATMQTWTELEDSGATSVSSAGRADNVQPWAMGYSPSEVGVDAQYFYRVAWDVATVTKAMTDEWWKVGDSSFVPGMTHTRSTSVTGVMHVDTTGNERLGTHAPGTPAILRADDGDYGLWCDGDIENLAPNSDPHAWDEYGSLIIDAPRFTYDPKGMLKGRRMRGTNLSGISADITPSSASEDITVVFWARGLTTTSLTCRVSLFDESSATEDTATFTVDSREWERKEVTLSWTNADVTATVAIHPSDTISSQSIIIGGEIAIMEVASNRIPYGFIRTRGAAATLPAPVNEQTLSGELDSIWGYKGEIEATAVHRYDPPAGVIVDIRNASNNNDRRYFFTSNGDVSFSHYNATGVVDTVVAGSGEVFTSEWTVRARWNQNEIRDLSTVYSDAISQTADRVTGRAATFTVSAATDYTIMRLGAGNGGISPFRGIIKRLRLRAREAPE